MTKKIPVPKFKASRVDMYRAGKRRSFEVTLERDADGWWVVEVPSLPGCHTQGRSIGQARNRIREAIAAWLDTDEATVDVTVRLPKQLEKLAEEVREKRTEAERVQKEAAKKSLAVAKELARKGISRRDVGEILGVSFQRVQQLVDDEA
jgi:predicted RNase H-like HicB family nuclease